MPRYNILFSIGAFSIITGAAYAAGPSVENTRCEHIVCPIGIDTPSPRLSWNINDTRKGASQKAYRIIVGQDSVAVASSTGNMWDSGTVDSDTMLVPYAGNTLQPQTKYFWAVTVTDNRGKKATSGVNSFETGIMNPDGWDATWISDGHGIDFRPAPYFRKEIVVEKKIASARAYVTAAGLFQFSINGKNIGDHVLDPLYTRFDRRNLYVTFDVTHMLNDGPNALGLTLGNGWYNHQSMGVWNFHNAPWRNRPAACLELMVTYHDGTTDRFYTDSSWKTTSEGPLIANSIYTGEQYDARKEMRGWDMPGYDDTAWDNATVVNAPSKKITAQQAVPIRACREIAPLETKRINDSTYLYDFGFNMAGITRLNVKGEKGTQVRVKHGERLDSDGRIDLSNINVYHRPVDDSDPFGTDIVTLSGNDDQFMPRFNYKGFRYVEVSANRPLELNDGSLTAYFIHSDVQPVSTLSASNPIIEKLWNAASNSYLSNLMGYPTDCPQREKNGWTGDGHFAIESALYNYDGITVYEKWLADHRDEQRADGVLPDIIPTGGWGYGTDNGTDWTSTIAIIPWELYRFYGDSKPLRDNYEAIKRYVDYVDHIAPDGLTTFGRGDWVPVKTVSNKELTSSIYFFVDATILSKAAALFGNTDDQQHYQALANKIRNAINDKYLDREKAIYGSGTQTELSMSLMWGIAPDELKADIARNLNAKVEEAGNHLDVGVLGAKALLNALCENGYAETAYKVAVQDTYPSWGWWIVNGANNLLENWDLQATRDISDNHMMFGEIGCWFFKGLGGIYPDEKNPGFKHIILRPFFPDGLDRFKATHDSPYGTIVSGWITKGNSIEYTVTIPANTSATLTFPTDYRMKPTTLTSGTHKFKLKK
ncbi:MAG: glycoside hydrolase family 78 protein [Clostridiales bacterium]|nr:glycoside hydrolase family 78 protein [Clostridiales bacterium]